MTPISNIKDLPALPKVTLKIPPSMSGAIPDTVEVQAAARRARADALAKKRQESGCEPLFGDGEELKADDPMEAKTAAPTEAVEAGETALLTQHQQL